MNSHMGSGGAPSFVHNSRAFATTALGHILMAMIKGFISSYDNLYSAQGLWELIIQSEGFLPSATLLAIGIPIEMSSPTSLSSNLAHTSTQ